MRRYRFVTPTRAGKWYPDLDSAKRFASQIGAGFFDTSTGRFVAYVGTRLEVWGQEMAHDIAHELVEREAPRDQAA